MIIGFTNMEIIGDFANKHFTGVMRKIQIGAEKDSTLEGVYKEEKWEERGFRTWLDGITTENFSQGRESK